MTQTKYRLKYRPFPNTTLTYHIDSYEIVDGVFIKFYDRRDDMSYSYPISKCEILEVSR